MNFKKKNYISNFDIYIICLSDNNCLIMILYYVLLCGSLVLRIFILNINKVNILIKEL